MKLLVAEDHEKLAQSIADGLREEGYSVDLTLNGDEAAGMLAGTRYDCVILDIMLPGREGWTILKELRDRGDLAPVLCLTARDTPEDRVRRSEAPRDAEVPFAPPPPPRRPGR